MRSFVNVAMDKSTGIQFLIELDKLSPGIIQSIIAIRVNVELTAMYSLDDSISGGFVLKNETLYGVIDEILSEIDVEYEFKVYLNSAVVEKCLALVTTIENDTSIFFGYLDDFIDVEDDEIKGEVIFEALMYNAIYSGGYTLLGDFDDYLKDVFLNEPLICVVTESMYYDRVNDSYVYPVMLYSD